MPDRSRAVAGVAAIGSLAVLGAGLLLLGVGSAIAGDLYALTLPWSGWGIDLVAAGLALTAITLGARVIVEPLGWWRLVALPPALATAFLWAILLFVGLGTGGSCCTQPSNPGVGTWLYSSPETAACLIISTLLIGLPLAIGRVRRGVPATTGATG